MSSEGETSEVDQMKPGMRRSGRVKNKPIYSEKSNALDGSVGSPSASEEETERKPQVKKKKGEEDEEEYEMSSMEEQSEVSEEYEEPSASSSDYGEYAENDGDEEWDRRRRQFVSTSRGYSRPYSQGGDLPPFLAEAVNRTNASTHGMYPKGRPVSLTPEQIQEIARNTVSTLASVNPITGKKLPMLLPRAPADQSEQIKSAVSQELKQSITSLLMDPSTREAMIRRLQGGSSQQSHPQQPVHTQPYAQQQFPQHSVPQEAITRPQPRPQHLAPRRINRVHELVEQTSLRPRRTPAKKIDYSGYFKEDEDEDLVVQGASDDSDSEEQVGIEKILSHKKSKGKEEYYVKYWGLSYLHCDWIEKSELESQKGMKTRLKKFHTKPLEQHHFDSKNVFNPEYKKIDRIVFGWRHEDEEDPGQQATSFLVKWVGLPYEDATWEKEDFLRSVPGGSQFISDYFKRPGIDAKRLGALPVGRRPDPGSWKPFIESPNYKQDHLLRPYQLEGVNWLVYCWMNKQSCIIADEMGLGKTVQSVAFLDLLYQTFSVRGPFLIVCPLSTLPHWQREFEAWSDLNVIIYHGSKASRDVMYEYEFFFKNAQDQPIPGFTKFDVLITTYEMAMAGIEQLANITWRAGIFDEAHRLKNRASKAADVLKTLEVEHKILLSGTPIQNSLLELWSLLNFLQPQRFYSEEEFMEEYGDLSSAEDVERLQLLLKPLMLRRLKEDVEKSIPVKEETIVEVELTPVQKRYYRAILEKNFAFLTQGCNSANAPNLLNAMMELRKCCIHPYLISGAEERISEELALSSDAIHQAMIQASGKLVLVDKLLRKLREGGHKVLIFSQMTRCLDILVDYLQWRQYPYERIDGAIKGSDRQASIDRFCDPSKDSFVFLLCTRAGGVGINLTAADTVVIFDSDWNPQNDLQAQARCHRIGQTKAVKIYRLITRNTYERDMFDRAGMKLGLDRAVLQKMVASDDTSASVSDTSTSAGVGPQLTRKEVEVLLKKGAYGVLMETDDAASRFCEEDIDQILERRTTVIRHDDTSAKADSSNTKGSIFSKASFTSTNADDFDIDIDDPNFWELWAKKLEMNPRALMSASSAAAGIGGAVDEPRVKRLIKRLKLVELGEEDWDCVKVYDLIPQKPSKTNLKWAEQELSLLTQQIAQHGIGRFQDIAVLFPARSKNDIIACAKALIKAAIELAEGDEKFKEDSEKAILWKIDFDKPPVAAKGKKVRETEEDLEGFTKAEIPYPKASVVNCMDFKSFLTLLNERQLSPEGAKKLVLRIQVMEMIRQIVERQSSSSGINKNIPVPSTISGAPMPSWWGRDADVDLLIGVFRHGYGCYERFKQDEELLFSTMSSELYEWPGNEELDGRVRKLLVNMEKRAQVASKLQQIDLGERRRSTPVSSVGKGKQSHSDSDSDTPEVDIKKTRKGKNAKRSAAETIKELRRTALRQWSPKEKNEFHRVLCLFGLPPVVASHGDSDSEEEMFFKGAKRDWTVFRSIGDFGDKSSNQFNEYCGEYLRLIELSLSADGDKPREAKGEEKLLPMDKAKKASHSIDIFSKLRSLNLDTCDLSKARRSSGLPKWWECRVHDKPFLSGVAKHGLSSPSSIISDPELSDVFLAVYEEARKDPSLSTNAANRRSTRAKAQGSEKEDLGAVVGWPNESIAMRRVEYLLELTLEGENGSSGKEEQREKKKGRKVKKIRFTHTALADEPEEDEAEASSE